MSRRDQWFGKNSIADILAVATVESLGPVSWQKLYRAFDNLEAALRATSNQLIKAGLTDHQVISLRDRPTQVNSAERLLASKKIEVLTIDSPYYPPLLRAINDPPLWLFVCGQRASLQQVCLTVVGTRQPSRYALAAVEKLLPVEQASQLCLVSGLSHGIDKAVHRLALKYKTPTIAVLAGGLDSIYPAGHHSLAEEIINAGGLLVTEYPPLSRPQPAKFPTRNRIMTGLSKLTVVIEAAKRSDSLNIAASAINNNRAVMAVPSDITRPDVDGTNFLIKQGATLLDDPKQISDLYGLIIKKETSALDGLARELLHLLAKQALSVDQMVELTKEPIPSVLGVLTELELLGQVFQSQPGFYQRKK